MKKNLLHGTVAGILSSIMGVSYLLIHQQMTLTDFNKVINLGSIAGGSMLGCTLMAIAYYLIESFNVDKLKGWMNIIIVVFSFLSILGPLTFSLPLDIDSPEFFPGLAVPMHFFPAITFFGLNPFFNHRSTSEN